MSQFFDLDCENEGGGADIFIIGKKSKFAQYLADFKYNFLRFIVKQKKNKKNSSLLLYIGLLCPFLQCMINLSFIFPVQNINNITGYTDFNWIAELFMYTRFDAIMVHLGLKEAFFYITIAIVYLPLLSLFIQMVLLQKSNQSSECLMKYFFNIPLILMRRLLIIPIFTIQLVYIYFTLVSPGASSGFVYGGEFDFNNLPFALVSLITLPVYLIETTIISFFLYENSFEARHSDLFAMPSSDPNKTYLMTSLPPVFIFFIMAEVNPVWFLVWNIAFFARVYVYYTQRLPFYSKHANFAFALSSGVDAWGSLAFIVGYTVDSGLTCFVLLVLILPFIVIFTKMILNIRYAKLDNIEKEDVQDLHGLEIWLRARLTKLEEIRSNDTNVKESMRLKTSEEAIAIIEEVDDMFNTATKHFEKEKILSIWEALFYIDIQNYPEALTKLSKAAYNNGNPDADFQSSKIQTVLDTCFENEQSKYIDYLRQIGNAKDCDLNVCNLVISLCNELYSFYPQTGKIENFLKALSLELKKTDEKYKELVKNFGNTITLELYGGFLVKLMNDQYGEQYLLAAANESETKERRRQEHTLFNRDLGICIISARPSDVGTVLHVNEQFLSIFGYIYSEVINNEYNKLLATPADKEMKSKLIRSIKYGYSLIELNKLLSLIEDEKGFLKSVDVVPHLTAWNSEPYILIAVQELDWCTILLNSDKFIKIHSDDLADIMLFSDNQEVKDTIRTTGKIIGVDIEEIFPGLKEQFLLDKTLKYVSSYNRKKVLMTITKLEFSFETNYVLRIKREVYHSSDTYNKSIKEAESNPAVEPKFVNFEEAKEEVLEDDPLVLEKKRTISIEGDNTNYGTTEQRFEERDHSLGHASYSNSSTLMTKGALSKLAPKLNQNVKIFKFFLFGVFFLEICACIVTLLFITSIITRVENVSLFRELSDLRYYSSDMALQARSLNLIDSGVLPQEKASFCIDRLNQDIEGIDRIIGMIKDAITDWPEQSQYYYFNKVVPVWEIRDGDYVETKTSLFDASFKIMLQALDIIESSEWKMTDPSMFYLYRNSVAEMLNFYNFTFFELVKAEEEDRKQTMIEISALVATCGGILAIGVLLFLAPRLTMIDQHNKEIWEFFNSQSLDTVSEVRQNALTRLESVHNTEDMTGWNAKRKKEAKYKPRWPYLLLKLGIFPLITVAFLSLAFIYTYSQVQVVLQTMPHYINWGGSRSTSILTSYFWLREHYLEDNPDYGYNVINKEGQSRIPIKEIDRLSTNLHTTMKILKNGNPDLGIHTVHQTDLYDEFMYIDGCIGISIEGCDQSIMKRGMYSGVIEFINNLEHYKNVATWEEIMALESEMERLLEGAQYTIDLYEDSTSNELSGFKNLIIYLTIVFIIIALCLYFCFYIPMINNYQRNILDITEIARFFVFNQK